MAMLRWAYVVLNFVLGTAFLLAFCLVAFPAVSAMNGALTGLLVCAAALAWHLFVMFHLVRIELLGRPEWQWWPFPNRLPFGIRLALLLLAYAVLGWLIYQAIVSPNEFHWPSLPALS